MPTEHILRRWRTERNYTYKQVGELLNVHWFTVRRWERRERFPRREQVKKIAAAIGADEREVLASCCEPAEAGA